MPTYTKTVDPNGGADYASISLWEAGEQALYSSGDIAIADCRRTGATKDTTPVSVAGWTPGVIPKVVVNSSYRHEGKWADTRVSDGNRVYILDTTGGTANSLYNDVADAEFDGLLVHANSGSITTLQANKSSTWKNLVTRGKRMMRVSFNGITVNMYNSVSYDTVDMSYLHVGGITTTVSNIFNCTFYGSSANAGRIYNDDGTINVKNTFAMSFADFGGSWGTSDYNVSSDATAKGTTVSTNRTAYATYFTDHANGDFHLKDTSANLFGIASENLSATFTDDIDGNTRPADSTFGLGADYYVAATGNTITASQTEAGDSTTAVLSNIVQLFASTAEAGDVTAALFAEKPVSSILCSIAEEGDRTFSWIGQFPRGTVLRATVPPRAFKVTVPARRFIA